MLQGFDDGYKAQPIGFTQITRCAPNLPVSKGLGAKNDGTISQ